MAGGTHVFDMIKMLKNNDNLRRLSYFKARQLYTRALKEKNIDLREATNEEMLKIRSEVIIERKRELKKSLITLAISIIITLTMVVLFIRYLRW